MTHQILCNKNITNRNSKCTLCKQFDETAEHISPCPILTKEQYRDMIEFMLNYTLTHARQWG
jgi:hypothetical protein